MSKFPLPCFFSTYSGRELLKMRCADCCQAVCPLFDAINSVKSLKEIAADFGLDKFLQILSFIFFTTLKLNLDF